jgi:hypothetical protein
MEMQLTFCEAGTEFLNIPEIPSVIKGLEV